ncbi:MAG TPA: hypothetical protein VNH46_08480 [Gemmatimonadales bacterium]|nr:hypothetical protein [Gemmatimonadales bacterium]
MRAVGTALAAFLLLAVGTLRAQDSLPPAADTLAPAAAPESTVKAPPPVSPMGALWRSLLLPGWGQAKLNRKLTGALFVTWEGVTLGMSIKTAHELRYLRRTGSGSVSSKERERQDWLVLLGFNHLFAAVEAYVSAHLWDFPTDLHIRAAPVPGGVGATVSVPVRFP